MCVRSLDRNKCAALRRNYICMYYNVSENGMLRLISDTSYSQVCMQPDALELVYVEMQKLSFFK